VAVTQIAVTNVSTYLTDTSALKVLCYYMTTFAAACFVVGAVVSIATVCYCSCYMPAVDTVCLHMFQQYKQCVSYVRSVIPCYAATGVHKHPMYTTSTSTLSGSGSAGASSAVEATNSHALCTLLPISSMCIESLLHGEYFKYQFTHLRRGRGISKYQCFTSAPHRLSTLSSAGFTTLVM
jgi:hypothetical protein